MILNLLIENRPSNELVELLNDSSILNRFDSLTSYCESSGISFSKKELKKIIENAEAYCKEILTIICVAQFRLMDQTQDWGVAGEEQIKTSFLRCLFQFTAEQNVEYSDFVRFDDFIHAQYLDKQLLNQSNENLTYIINNFFIKLFDKEYRSSNWEELTRILRFLGSKKGLLVTSFGQSLQLIFGDIQVKQVGFHKVTYFLNEDIRSPSIIVPKVAMSQDSEVFIRYDALRCIFYQKWVPVLENNMMWLSKVPERNISEGIKKKVLEKYNISSSEELKLFEKRFVKDLSETIVYHELGHVISRHDILDQEIAACTEGSQIFDYSISMSLFELLADFAPSLNKIKGPLKNIVDISKKDPNRAEAMFYMYLSDVWFYDTFDEYMFTYSDLMVLSMLRYVKDDQSINFKKLEHDIYFKSSEKDDQKDSTRFVNFLYDSLTQIIQRVQMHVKKMEFELDGKTLTFEQLKAMIELQFVVNNSKHEQGDYFYTSSLWSFIFKAVQKLAKSKSLPILLEAEKKGVIRKLYLASAGKDALKKYGQDHRQFIFERMAQIGILGERQEGFSA